jgi:hypothetical protein
MFLHSDSKHYDLIRDRPAAANVPLTLTRRLVISACFAACIVAFIHSWVAYLVAIEPISTSLFVTLITTTGSVLIAYFASNTRTTDADRYKEKYEKEHAKFRDEHKLRVSAERRERALEKWVESRENLDKPGAAE